MNEGLDRHLLGLEGMSREGIEQILDTAENFKEIAKRPVKKVPALRGKNILMAFFEPSTRTKMSFQMAAKRLSADTYSISTGMSSLVKGETLIDTVRNIEAMAVDMIVMRHGFSGAHRFLSRYIDKPIINAGDGWHEHPTQALLDMLTMRDNKGGFEGLKVAIVGDIAHSRVAHSNIFGLTSMGAQIHICGPYPMIPMELEKLGNVTVFPTIEDAIRGVDVIMMLRIQLERMSKHLFPTSREYSTIFGLNRKRVELAHKDAIIMHPGPINRGVEMEPDVADGPRSVILDQVTNGVAVRMAVLYLQMGVTQ